MRKKSDMAARLFRFFANIDAFDAQVTVSMPDQSSRDFQECCFSGAIAAEESEELPSLHAKRDATERGEMPKCLADILRFECECLRHICSRATTLSFPASP